MSFAIKQVSRLYTISVWFWNSIKWGFVERGKYVYASVCLVLVCVNPAHAFVWKSLQTKPNLLQHEQTGDYIKWQRCFISSRMRFCLCQRVFLHSSAGVHAQTRGRGGKKKWKTKLHLHRQSKLHWLSCVSYNVVITSIRIPPPCCENESLIRRRFPSSPLAFVPHSYGTNHFITMRCEM